jgi:hypothetical protein
MPKSQALPERFRDIAARRHEHAVTSNESKRLSVFKNQRWRPSGPILGHFNRTGGGIIVNAASTMWHAWKNNYCSPVNVMTAASESPLVLADRLIQNHVPVVIIGGHAVNFHGHIRATEDVDLIYRRTPHSVPALFNVLRDANAFRIGTEIDPATGIERTHPVTLADIENNRVLMLGSDHGYIDLFDFIPGLPDEPLDDLFATAINAGGRPFASLEWLKRMKVAAGRPRDLEDLKYL